jgi:putative ABC transport system permease protein
MTMGRFGRELWTVVRINLLSIGTRLWPSLTTMLTVALVIAVLTGFEAMAGGFRTALEGAGSDDIAIVLGHGAEKELNSAITREQAALMERAPGLAPWHGRPAVSSEFYVLVDAARGDTGVTASLALRGMDPAGPSLRRGYTLLSGRMFRPGHAELIVGSALAHDYAGLAQGGIVRFGKTSWRIVGVFSTGGSVDESELWGDRETVRAAFARPNLVQSIRLRLASPDALAGVQAFSDRDVRLKLSVLRESTYLRDQASRIGDLILSLGLPLALALALGAIAGAVNATYNSVAARSAEIATLRALGFGGTTAFLGTLAESLVLALAGGIIGILIVLLAFDGLTASTISGGFTQLIFALDLTPAIVLRAIVGAAAIGLLGGLAPAIRSARQSVTEGLHGEL